MTVDGVPRPRTAASPAERDERPAPAVPFARRPVDVTAVAPPWQRIPVARRPVVRLVTRDGVDVRPVPDRPAPVSAVYRPPVLRARPPVVEDPGILGLSRLTRGRIGSRVFTLFFVAVFALIAVQTLVELLH